MPPEPLIPLPKDTTVSEPATVPPLAVKAPASEVILPPVIDTPVAEITRYGAGTSADTPSESTPEPEKTTPSSENFGREQQPEAQNEPDSAPEPIAESAQTQTAQIPANEPIGYVSAPVDGPLKPEPTGPQGPLPFSKTDDRQENKVAQVPIPIPTIPEPRSRARELLTMARNAMQFRKRKKLEKILGLLEKRTSNGSTNSPQVTNDEVEKLLHVSDVTATRYLDTLEKEGRIKQVGREGKGIYYEKI